MVLGKPHFFLKYSAEMFKVRYTEKREPFSLSKVGDKFIVEIHLGESVETVEETRTLEDGSEVTEEVTYYNYRYNSFSFKNGEMDINYIKENPAIFLFYGPEFDKRKKAIVDAVQKMMDETAQSRNYDDIFTAISYKDSTVESFRNEALACLEWRDNVWVTCYAILNDVVTMKRDLPELDEILAELPTINW